VQRGGDQTTQNPQAASHLGNYAVKGCVHELDGIPCLVLVGPLVQSLPDVEHVIEVVHLLQKNTTHTHFTSELTAGLRATCLVS